MTSPPEKISICCPACKLIYEDWWRPSINPTLESFDADYIDEASSATCPRCEVKISLPTFQLSVVPTAQSFRHDWRRLSPLQIGRYAEYFVKMEMTLYGLEVYSSEVDDRGIDFVARSSSGVFYEIQVKSAYKTNYVFFQKDKFSLRPSLLTAFVLLVDGSAPELYLIPSQAWKSPSPLLVSRDYEGKKSKPEWGLTLSKKNRPLLSMYAFEKTIAKL